jgi:uncharacterized phage-associated protein
MTSPLYVANTLIFRAKRQQVDITHLKLQKLIYILYAHYLARTNDALFPDRFEAWKYGPALSMIYYVFRNYSADPIPEPVAGIDGKIWLVREFGERWFVRAD